MERTIFQRTDYARLYHYAFNSITQAVEALQLAQQQMEEIYLQAEITEIPPTLRLIEGGHNHEKHRNSQKSR